MSLTALNFSLYYNFTTTFAPAFAILIFEVLAGRMDKSVLGSGGGAMIHVTWLELGPAAAQDLIDQVQVIVNHWLINWGFTIGVADTVAGNDTLLEIDTIIQDAKKQVSGLVKKGQVRHSKRRCEQM